MSNKLLNIWSRNTPIKGFICRDFLLVWSNTYDIDAFYRSKAKSSNVFSTSANLGGGVKVSLGGLDNKSYLEKYNLEQKIGDDFEEWINENYYQKIDGIEKGGPSSSEIKKWIDDKRKEVETNNFKPKIKSSFKPFVLLFDEMYTEIYRFSEAEEWMNAAKKMIFIGTSFSVNITSIALRIGMSNNIPIEIVDPKPMKLNYPNIKYFEMSGEEYCKLREDS